MFANGHHSMMGSTEDPKDGKKVAGAVFGAVIVYAVSSMMPWMLR
jgi:ribonuclease kappa